MKIAAPPAMAFLAAAFVFQVLRERVARHAYRRYGRDSQSGVRLNFGACFSYALSVTTGEPLLFVGEGFRHTDVAAALPTA